MKRYTLIFTNQGLQHFEIDEPIGYQAKNYTNITFVEDKKHEIKAIKEHLDKYGFESRSYLLVEDNDKLDYFFLNNAKQKFSGEKYSVEFNIVEPGTFRQKQIYNPNIIKR
jgi:hypothetical protein